MCTNADTSNVMAKSLLCDFLVDRQAYLLEKGGWIKGSLLPSYPEMTTHAELNLYFTFENLYFVLKMSIISIRICIPLHL